MSFVAAGAGAGAYYVYANVIEPQNQAQRVLQAEQAQKELLMKLEEEEEVLRRGTNKQAAKKKPIAVTRPKKIEHDNNSDVTPEDLNDKISTSNPFDLLERPHAVNGTATTKSKKGTASKKKTEVIVTATTATDKQQQQEKSPKAVSFDPKPEIKELPKVVISKKERKTANKKEAAPITPPATVQLKVAVATAVAESTKTGAQALETGSPKEPEHPHAPEVFRPARGHRNTFAASAPSAPVIPEAFQTVKSSKSLQVRKQQQQQQQQQLQQNLAVEKTAVEEPPQDTVATVSEEECALALQELKALQALVQARDLALAAAERRAERSMRKIQELQEQIESEAALVKSAQKTENKAQRLNEKVESLHYTNSILVRQLSVEKENLKTAQLQAIKKEAELAATAAAAAESVANKSPSAEWETKLEALEQERIQHTTQVAYLQDLNRELQHHRTQSESEISQLSQSLTEADRRAEGTLLERNEIHHRLSMTVSDKEARIASLEADIGALEGELESSKVQVEQYAEAVNQTEEVSQRRFEILEGEKHSLLEEIDLLRGQLTKEETNVVEKDAEIKKVQRELETVWEQVRILEGDNASTQIGGSKMAGHTERSNENSNKELEESATLNKRIQELEQEMVTRESSHRMELTEKEALATELAQKKAAFEELATAKQGVDAELEALIEASEAKKSEIEQEYEALSLRVVELEYELEGVRQHQQQRQTKGGEHIGDEVVKVVETVEVTTGVQDGGEGSAEKNETVAEGERQGHELFNVQVEGLAVATY
ncbi:hypothetical protein BGZ96_009878 [Linnemannia gamsii]|uniref:Uncharacterized protein n=1 Tax=Linnemannia gamsii TaxID=64522 RepID=A0ABQ7JVX2_9FUNG|nr:hypothetical protein BGZ96_009878 [Linnemannia gamsii]